MYRHLKKWGKSEHAKAIAMDLEAVPRTFETECGLCGNTTSVEADDAKIAAGKFYDNGWRITNSDHFQQIGLTCPECTPNVNNPEYWGD